MPQLFLFKTLDECLKSINENGEGAAAAGADTGAGLCLFALDNVNPVMRLADALKAKKSEKWAELISQSPYKEMYDLAGKDYQRDEIAMVGDDYTIDIKSAVDYGMYAFYLNSKARYCNKKTKIIRTIYDLRKYL